MRYDEKDASPSLKMGDFGGRLQSKLFIGVVLSISFFIHTFF
jgi:hypothetical protein